MSVEVQKSHPPVWFFSGEKICHSTEEMAEEHAN